MSTAKRSSKRRQAESQPSATASPLPASKRLKSTHVPVQSGLGFLVDEDARAGKKIEAKLTNGAPRTKSTHVDESHTGVAPNTEDDGDADRKQKVVPEVIAISSGEEESSDLEEDDEDNEIDDDIPQDPIPIMNGHMEDGEDGDAAVSGTNDAEMADAEGEPQDEPTFGDLLQARHPDPIDVGKSLQKADQDSRGVVPATFPTEHSLGTILSQALRSNDKNLLETCFSEKDPNTIRRTIQRQKSHEIATLLEIIAERIHRNPGRTGTLLVWVQWSLVSHGGYLANQPELMRKVKALGQVVRERAAGLQPLLHLKGKLDLLSAQLDIRRNMLDDSRALNAEDVDDPDGVLYIEGEDQHSSDSDDAEEADDMLRLLPSQKTKKFQDISGDESQEEGMNPRLPNGLELDGDDDSSVDENDDDGDGMLDIEAEEGSENDEEDSEEEAASDQEEEDDDDESDDGESDTIVVKPPHPKNLNRKR